MAERGLDVHDTRSLRLIEKRVGACLKHYRQKGVLRAEKGPGAFLLWELPASKLMESRRHSLFGTRKNRDVTTSDGAQSLPARFIEALS